MTLKLCLILLLLVCKPTSAASLLKLYTEDFPPLNYYQQGKLTGPAVDIVKAIQNEINSQASIEVMPWKRAFKTTLKNKNSVIFSIARSAEREALFSWVGPIAIKRYALYSLSKNHIKLNSLAQAKDYIIGVQAGGIAQEHLQMNKKLTLYAVKSPQQSLKMLIMERIDLLYTDQSSIIELSQLLQIPLNSLNETMIVKKESMYIGFNKHTSKDIILLWKKSYQNLYKRGVIKEIFINNKMLELYPKDQIFSPLSLENQQ